MKQLILSTTLLALSVSAFADTNDFAETCTPNDNELKSLACNIYFEARGEGHVGMLAVAFNTMNRADSALYPGTVSEVVWQKGQYSWTEDRIPNVMTDYDAFVKSMQVASYVYHLNKSSYLNRDITKGSMWYHSDTVTPYWTDVNCITATIGSHTYYNCAKKG